MMTLIVETALLAVLVTKIKIMKLDITPENAQTIADIVSKETFALLVNIANVSEDQFKQAETKALLSLGYQPAVYHRKMIAIWNNTPWHFRAFMDMEEEDFSI